MTHGRPMVKSTGSFFGFRTAVRLLKRTGFIIARVARFEWGLLYIMAIRVCAEIRNIGDFVFCSVF